MPVCDAITARLSFEMWNSCIGTWGSIVTHENSQLGSRYKGFRHARDVHPSQTFVLDKDNLPEWSHWTRTRFCWNRAPASDRLTIFDKLMNWTHTELQRAIAALIRRGFIRCESILMASSDMHRPEVAYRHSIWRRCSAANRASVLHGCAALSCNAPEPASVVRTAELAQDAPSLVPRPLCVKWSQRR